MTQALLALQEAVFAALKADAPLALLVGGRIHDAAPRHTAFPYVSFGAARSSDWSTDRDSGAEHRLHIDVWSRQRGRRETCAIIEAVEAALADAAPGLDGHVLVNLRLEFSETRRERDGITWHGIMRFRAVTEAA